MSTDSYSVTRMFHPTHHVPDLEAVVEWFRRVFGRESRTLSGTPQQAEIERHRPGYPTQYSAFTPIGEVLFETLAPHLLVKNGRQSYPSVDRPILRDFAWYVDGVGDLYPRLHEEGIRTIRQHGSDPDAEPPRAEFADLILYWADPADAGLRYEFYDPRGGMLDHRKDPAWSLADAPDCDPAVDPLGILLCSHHTVLTARPERALRLLVDILHGTVIDAGRNEQWETESTFVAIGDGVIEVGRPLREDSPAAADLRSRGGTDAYHGITWCVRDLDAVKDHLGRQKVGLQSEEETMVITDPADSIGIPFGFTTRLIAGDTREGRRRD